jgi:rubrerythrin
MEGGIRAWQGLTASGAPESGMAYFPENSSASDRIALAWLLEEGNRRFYHELPELLHDGGEGELFRNLDIAEQNHQQALAALYEKVTQTEFSLQRHQPLLPAQGEDVMEGGIPVKEALAWAGGRKAGEILEFAIALETNSYDLYIKMGRRVNDEQSKTVFEMLSREEKNHLDRLVLQLDRTKKDRS